MKKITVLLLVLFIFAAFTEVHGDALSDVTQKGVLRVGSSPEYIPFVFYDENGTMTGLDIALIEEVGRRMGVNVQTVDIAFDGLLDSLEIGQIDIIGRGISKTPAREELIDFSSVYYKGAAQFIALASLPKPAEVDQSCFSNRRIGVQKATSFEEWIRDNLVSGGYVDLTNVYLYSNAVDLMKGLDRGDVDLVIIDQDVYESLYQSSGNYQVFYEGFLEEGRAGRHPLLLLRICHLLRERGLPLQRTVSDRNTGDVLPGNRRLPRGGSEVHHDDPGARVLPARRCHKRSGLF